MTVSAICNLCVEAGAKTALMEVDDSRNGLPPCSTDGNQKHCFTSDEDAVFAEVYDIDLGTIHADRRKTSFRG